MIPRERWLLLPMTYASLLVETLVADGSRSFVHRRLAPGANHVLHFAGQSEAEFSGYSMQVRASSGDDNALPLGYTTYHAFTELNTTGASATYFRKLRATLDMLGDTQHAVIPHVSLALTPGSEVLPAINRGDYDLAIREFADALPLAGRPVFVRVGYEFNGHWNNYSAGPYVAAWHRLESFIARNATTRARVALVWDMSCDAVAAHGDHIDPAPFFPGDSFVDWWGVNVFNKDPNGLYDSRPNATCVLDFVRRAAEQGFPVLIAESLPRFVAGVTAANAWETWFTPFFQTLLSQPSVQGFSYINRDCSTDSAAKSHCVGGQWGDARLEGPNFRGGTTSNESVTSRYVRTLQSAKFVHSCSLECIEAKIVAKR